MRKTLVFGLIFFSYVAFMSSCGGGEHSHDHDHGSEQHEHSHEAGDDHHHDHDHDGHEHMDAETGKEYSSAFICPMHCEGSGGDAEGKCPVCEMDYKKNPDHKAENAPADSTM